MSTPGGDTVIRSSGAPLGDKIQLPKHVPAYSHPVDWLEALSSDDVETAAAIIESASRRYKDFLMNGTIPSLKESRFPLDFCITKPLHSAAVFHSRGILQLLWTSGIDTLQLDIEGNNVVHMLISAAHAGGGGDRKHAETLAYIQTLFSQEELKSLMMAENTYGLRPLELAALQGCHYVLNIIFITKGVYLVEEEHVGYNVVQYLDVSDYELFEGGAPPRCFHSPLAFLFFVNTSHMGTTGSYTVFKDTGLKSWINAKITMNWPFVFIWFLFRVAYFGLFFSSSLESTRPHIVNRTWDNTPSVSTMTVTCLLQQPYVGKPHWHTLTLISVLILVYDFYEYLSKRNVYNPSLQKLLNGRGDLVHVRFYYYTQTITCLSMVVISTCQLLRYMGIEVPSILDHTLFVVVSCGCAWGLVYFLQVLPWMSIYAIAVQRMIHEFTRFMLIFAIFFCTLAISFHRILISNSDECPQHFETFGETIYSSFLVMINGINFREYEHADKTSLYLVHVLFVFFISILLLNFLIATMTQSFSEVYINRNAIMQIQVLALMISIERRLARHMRTIYKKLQNRVFVLRNNRLCLRRTFIRGINTNGGHLLSTGSDRT